MTTEQMIIEIKKRKTFFFISVILVFAGSFVSQYRLLQTFKSTAKIIVNETDVTDRNGPTQFVDDFINSTAPSVNRLFKFAYSSEMVNHLIKKFNLYTYYQIDPSQTFAYEKLVTLLCGRINLRKSEQNIIEITVTDKDRFQAASMANEIAQMLSTINEAYLKKQLKRKIVLYEGIYSSFKNDLDQHENKMLKILDNYKSLMTSLEENKMNVENVKHEFTDLINGLKNKTEELIKIKQRYVIMLETVNKEHLETITIINIALPDYRSNTFYILIMSVMIALITGCIMVVLLNVYLTHKKYIELIFKK